MRCVQLLLVTCVACKFPVPPDLVDDASTPDALLPDSSGQPLDAGPVDFGITLSTSRMRIAEGSSSTLGVTLTRNDFPGDVTVTIAGLPAGITAEPITISGNTGTLVLSAVTGATQGDSNPTITAAAESRSHDASLSLLVMGPPGTLDKSFHRSAPMMQVPGHDIRSAHATGMALQPDGKIVLAGIMPDPSSTLNGGLVVRYLPNGDLDTSFSGGLVRFDVVVHHPDAWRADVALQADGKIVLAWTTGRYPTSRGQVVRLNADGTLDSQFGDSGKKDLILSAAGASTSTALAAVAIDQEGGIVVAGSARLISGGREIGGGVIARLSPNGILDASFGTAGRTILPLGAERTAFFDLILQRDGRMIAVGPAQPSQSKDIVALARFNRDGSLDSNFSEDGVLISDIDSPSTDLDDSAVALALQPDGKVIATGGTSGNRFYLLRLNNDGSFDATFGTNGIKLISITGRTFSLALQSDGKLLTSGFQFTEGVPAPFVARFNTDILFDFSFAGGVATTSIPIFGSGEEIGTYSSILLDADGRIIAAGGYAGAFGQDNIILDRFWP